VRTAWHLSIIITASTHYNSGSLISECNGLSQFREGTSRTSVPVREINKMCIIATIIMNIL